MYKRLFSILQYIIFLGGGIFLVWWQLKGMTAEDKVEFFNAFHNANYWLIIPIVIMSLLSHLSRSYRWKLLMEPLEYNPKIKNVFTVTMIGYLANSAIPRLGEVLKCTFLARYEKLKVEKLVGTILIERTFDVLCYFAFIAITVLIQIDVVSSYVKEKISEIGNASATPLWLKLAIALVLIFGIIYTFKLLFKRYPHNKLIGKINSFFKGLAEGFISIKNLKKRKLFIAHTLFIWSMYLLQIYIGFKAMDGTMHLDIKAACSVLALATLAMIATPGGIGSFPFFVMETLLIYGIASPLGKAFGWLIWGVSTAIILVVGLICLLLLPYINKKSTHESNAINSQ
ncbi:MAG: flippase-like domain-containing protein [Chitinophagaceae bacterium]|nr:flippase-like domain-containing protein [Chitinophagaceae bacterium]